MRSGSLTLTLIPKSDSNLREWMQRHYSAPKGFVGRQLIYRVTSFGVIYGAIAAGSVTRFLPGRNDFFGGPLPLNSLVNNTFFHIEKQAERYPFRNFTSNVVAAWRERVLGDWPLYYGDKVRGWETLVEPPRTGALYLKDGWKFVGMTKGFTCKREAGVGTDSWSGRRVWSDGPLRPKMVFVRGL